MDGSDTMDAMNAYPTSGDPNKLPPIHTMLNYSADSSFSHWSKPFFGGPPSLAHMLSPPSFPSAASILASAAGQGQLHPSTFINASISPKHPSPQHTNSNTLFSHTPNHAQMSKHVSMFGGSSPSTAFGQSNSGFSFASSNINGTSSQAQPSAFTPVLNTSNHYFNNGSNSSMSPSSAFTELGPKRAKKIGPAPASHPQSTPSTPITMNMNPTTSSGAPVIYPFSLNGPFNPNPSQNNAMSLSGNHSANTGMSHGSGTAHGAVAPMSLSQAGSNMVVDHASLLSPSMLAGLGLGGMLNMGMMMADTRKKRKRGSAKQNRSNLFCQQCGTNSTPEWRKGPNGPGTLCNACGLQYSKKIREEKLKEKERLAALGLGIGIAVTGPSTANNGSNNEGAGVSHDAGTVSPLLTMVAAAAMSSPALLPSQPVSSPPTIASIMAPASPSSPSHSPVPSELMSPSQSTPSSPVAPSSSPSHSIIGISPVMSPNMASAMAAALNSASSSLQRPSLSLGASVQHSSSLASRTRAYPVTPRAADDGGAAIGGVSAGIANLLRLSSPILGPSIPGGLTNSGGTNNASGEIQQTQ